MIDIVWLKVTSARNTQMKKTSVCVVPILPEAGGVRDGTEYETRIPYVDNSDSPNKIRDSETIGSKLSIDKVDIDDAGIRECNNIQRFQFSRRSGVGRCPGKPAISIGSRGSYRPCQRLGRTK